MPATYRPSPARAAIGLLALLLTGCPGAGPPAVPRTAQPNAGKEDPTPPASSDRAAPQPPPITDSSSSATEDPYAEPRRRMVDQQIRARDIQDPRVLAAMLQTPRHEFVPEELRSQAYADYPLPIGHGQTISQPYIVALMTELARPKPDSRALDVGTGSGYQAAILSRLCKEVYSIEILAPLADQAKRRLQRLGCRNVHVRCGDGYRGWPEHAPFDLIIVAAAPDHIPPPLLEQLAVGGRLVIPVGRYQQDLIVAEKQPDGQIRQWKTAAVAFVPMTGRAEAGEPAP